MEEEIRTSLLCPDCGSNEIEYSFTDKAYWCKKCQDWCSTTIDFPFGPIPHWIKCSEHPPQKGAIYLLYQTFPEGTVLYLRANPLKKTKIHIGGLRYDGKFVSIYDQFSEEGIKHITHYMPLPEPPHE